MRRYATVPYTTVALIACPDGNDELTAVVSHANTLGRARWYTSFSAPLRRMLPIVAARRSRAECLCSVCQRNSAVTPTIVSTTVPVPRYVISTITCVRIGD